MLAHLKEKGGIGEVKLISDQREGDWDVRGELGGGGRGEEQRGRSEGATIKEPAAITALSTWVRINNTTD